MDHKRPAAATFGGQSAKRVKKEIKGEGNFDRKIDLSSIPMAPKVEKKPKLENKPPTDYKPFNLAIQHGQQENRKARSRRGFWGNSIKVNRGNGDLISAHYNQREKTVEFTCSRGDASLATWDTEDVEREVFERLNKAHFDVVPVGGWGFLGELLDPDWFYPQALQPYTLKVVVDVEWGTVAVQEAAALAGIATRRLMRMVAEPQIPRANSTLRAGQQTYDAVERLGGNTEPAPQSQNTSDSKVESSAAIKAEQSIQKLEETALNTSKEIAQDPATPTSPEVHGQPVAPEVKAPVLPTVDRPPPLTDSAVLATEGAMPPQPMSFVDSMKVLADKLEADRSPRLTNRPLFSFGSWPGTHVGGGSFTPVNAKPVAEDQAPAADSSAFAGPTNSAIGLGSEENAAEASSVTK